MANNQRWRNTPERYGYRDDDRDRWRDEGLSTRSVPDYTPALSTKDSYFREKVDATGFRPAHLASNGEAKHRRELQGRRYPCP